MSQGMCFTKWTYQVIFFTKKNRLNILYDNMKDTTFTRPLSLLFLKTFHLTLKYENPPKKI